MRLLWLVPLVAACQKAPPSESTAAPASASAAPSAKPAAPERPWFQGSWRGTFDAQPFRIELPAGGVKEWKQDDGKRASGPGTLELEIAADGTLSGKGSGALGELVASGHAETDRVAISLRAAEPEGFHGFVLAAQTPEGLRGTLQASSGDSLVVRRADVTFTRAAP